MKWELKISIVLLLSSIFFYAVNYLTFHDTGFIEKYILAQLGFLPISVLLVSIVLNSLMVRRTKKERQTKLNIVIGSFFGEVGKDLLRYLSKYDIKPEELAREVISLSSMSVGDIKNLEDEMKTRKFQLKVRNMNLYELRKFLIENKEFIVNILDNPVILEHETFTDLLWNVLHVTEELKRIINFDNISEDDYEDIKGDLEKLYFLLSYEWVKYVRYLHDAYPHIFQYEARTAPFIPHSYHVKKKG